MDIPGRSRPEQGGMAKRPRRDVFLFSHPRTASNLLCHLLSNQPGWLQSSYNFQSAFKFARKSFGFGPLVDVDAATRREFESILQDGFDDLEKTRDAARAQQMCLLVKNHTFHVWEPSSLSQDIWGGAQASPYALHGSDSKGSTNPTFLDDDFLTSWIPVFLIRHPALVFESWYKAESRIRSVDLLDKSWAYVQTFRYSRQLYDWYLTNSVDSGQASDTSCEPIVIDADDLIEGKALEKLCELCNMDPSLIQYEWNAMPSEEGSHSPRHQSYLSGLRNSTSVDKSKTSKGLKMEDKRIQWENEFGKDVADALCKLVEDSMVDFTYLRSKGV